MSPEKLAEDTAVLHRFISLYCERKHQGRDKAHGFLHQEYHLCAECKTLLHYAHAKLIDCPHEVKPSCRKCPKPCYERAMWKKMAKIMMYSGMHLGFTKMRKLLFNR